MIKSEWLSWLKSQQNNIDSIIANAAMNFFETHQKNENFWYDVHCAQNESYNLSQNKDLCYDRVATPLSYSLWYQARRVNTFLSHFIDQLIEIEFEDRIDLFDLGAGTGAVQMSLGLIFTKLKRDNKPVPKIRIYNVDSSPFMLSYNRNILWPEFFKFYPEAREIYTEYHLNSWNNNDEVKLYSPWISASYLFDMSDNSDQIKQDFFILIEIFKPSNLLLLTSDQPKKKQLLNDLIDGLTKRGWAGKNENAVQLIFQGTPIKVNEMRKHFANMSGISTLVRQSSWTDYSFISTKVKKIVQNISFDISATVPKAIDLYNPPLKIRTQITLSEDQKKAAKYSKRPAIIIGPAGCGKSVVISERIINIIKAHEGGLPISILLTTFNKELLKKLAEWLLELLQKNNKLISIERDNDYNGYPNGSATIKCNRNTFDIRLIHFDMLAKYIGNIPLKYFNQTQHEGILRKYINQVSEEKNIKLKDYENILNTDFLLEEYHRVIYGLQCKLTDGLETYQNVSRKGRGSNPSLAKGLRRELVWNVLYKYGQEIYRSNFQSFTTRRQLLLHKIKSNTLKKFDFVIVDEFQDCTQADFEIFSGILKNVDNLIIAGDIAQAIHIGRSATIPKTTDMSSREYFRLKGSYRLPQRISECILELSKKIKEGSSNDIEEISPYKGSPPGARPIIIYGYNNETIAKKIASAFNSYKNYGITKITILEKDKQLCDLLTAKGLSCETDSVLKLKGLEKECIVWSTSKVVEFEKEIKEFVYTILTRTSCLLIITFDNAISENFLGIFSLLDKERLIFFDKDSEQKFNEKSRPYIDSFGKDED
jgi:DNA helicase-2/ATP-dependent DNA helicase PcrA